MRPSSENSPSNVLIVDDDPAILSLLTHLLESGRHKVRTAADGNQALQMILQECPDVLITDWMMPCLDGLELTRRVRQLHARKVLPHYLYVLLMTSQSSKSSLIEGLEAGADDFIEKSVSSLSDLWIELQARMNAARRIRQLEISLEFAAKYDYLTQLMNRISFFGSANTIWDRSVRNKEQLAVVMLDCDFFKRINDIHGHSAGDTVLKEVAASMRNHSRSTDLLCRYGGEEFVALLPGCSEQMAYEWADRLRQQLEANPIKRDGFEISVTVSFGVAERDNTTATLEQLIDHSDAALLAAKERGRNWVVRFSELAAEGGDVHHSGVLCRLCGDYKAEDVMVPFPRTLSMRDTVSGAMDILLNTQSEMLPVFTDVGFFAGVVSLRDIFSIIGDQSHWVLPIEGVLSRTSISYPPDTPLRTISNFFGRSSTRLVLITDGKTQVGYISRLSLADRLREQWRQISNNPKDIIPVPEINPNIPFEPAEKAETVLQAHERDM